MTKARAQVQTRTQRLRRVMLLACQFSRNLAYYRAGMSRRQSRIVAAYWKTVTSNCLDVCILEWCKLFADPRDPHHWRNVIPDPATFEVSLYERLRVSAARFEVYRLSARRYRDKFLAHLDSDLVMEIPNLDLALSAACIYYSLVRDVECKAPTSRCFPTDLFEYYSDSEREGNNVMLTYMEASSLRSR